MKVSTNQELIEKRAKWAKRIAPLTMLFLIGGLVTNFLSINQPEYFRPTLILLALGFISAIISSHLVNHWVREPRADQVLTKLLKKLGNDYLLFNYTAPVPHVLVAPDGVYVFVVKNHDGQITVKGKRFSRKFNWRRIFRLLGEEGLGVPVTEAENRVTKLRKFLSKHMAEENIPALKPVVLLSNQEMELTIDSEPPIPVLTTRQIKSFLREAGKGHSMPADQRRELAELLDKE